MDLLEPAVLSLPSPGTDFVGTDSLSWASYSGKCGTAFPALSVPVPSLLPLLSSRFFPFWEGRWKGQWKGRKDQRAVIPREGPQPL